MHDPDLDLQSLQVPQAKEQVPGGGITAVWVITLN